MKSKNIAILGASGYTGADLIRLSARHPHCTIKAMTANTHAGKKLSEVYPHLSMLDLPPMLTVEDVNWEEIDVVFCGLPHATSQRIIKNLFEKFSHLKIIDMSADFRLKDIDTYQQWYGHAHCAKDIQTQVAYGLTEHNREKIKKAKVVACPGCYPTATLLTLLPLIKDQKILLEDLIIDAKSGVSGAGRGLKQNTLFCETGEGLSPYAIGKHRHSPEIEQELSITAGQNVRINFTPHLVPMSRGELVTCYVKLAKGETADSLREHLKVIYKDESFIHCVNKDIIPQTQNVRGSNHVLIGVFEDRLPNRAIIVGTLDNLVKGSAGQALQNFNLMHGFDENLGLEQLPLFP